MAEEVWYVIETPCYPNGWKVVSGRYRNDNATVNYFKTRALAQGEADARNARESDAENAAPIDWHAEMRKCVGDAAELADRISTSDSDVSGALGRLCNVVTHLLDENKELRERMEAAEARLDLQRDEIAYVRHAQEDAPRVLPPFYYTYEEG